MGRRGRPPKPAVVQVAVSDSTELGNDLGLHEVAIEDEDSRENSVIEGSKAGGEKWVVVSRGAKKQVM
ncbi:hypothetical protein Dimus_021312 [Dionaea muscipula]